MTGKTPAAPRRPQYHFTPPAGWLNDPNGLVFYQGEYHLFYQHHPYSLTWGPMHWGHAVSADLVRWTHLPVALAPDENGTIFSGCVVADDGNTSGLVPGGGLVAVFSFDTQAQGIAYSHDCGRTWVKYDGNPVIASPGRDFRDPKVFWHAPASCWIMALAAGDHVAFLRSPNLIDWTPTGSFGAEHGAHGGVWECPDLISFEAGGETKWVLIVSVGDGAYAGGSGTQYFVGRFDGENFHSDHPPGTTLWLDDGPDNYAGVTYNGIEDGRRVLLGWMNNWAYAKKIPAEMWRGSMTVPRALALIDVPGAGLRLAQRPVAELDAYRTTLVDLGPGAAESALRHHGLGTAALDLEVVFGLGDADAFGVLVDAGSGRTIEVRVEPQAQRLIVDRTHSGSVDFDPAFSPLLNAPLPLTGATVALRILLDAGSIEVFGSDGLTVVTAQVFHGAPELGISVFASNGTAAIQSLRIHRLEFAPGR